jgi:hypothetical protein
MNINEENFVRKSANRKVRKIKTTKSQKQKMALTPKNRNTMEPISHFRAQSQLKKKRMKGSMSMTGYALRGIRGKSPFRQSRPQKRKSVIKVSTISYNQTPDKVERDTMNKSIINTRIESQKEFQNQTGSKMKKQIVYTKRGQEIMDSLISTGKARIADKKDLKEIIKRKNKRGGKKGMKDSPYHYSQKNLKITSSRSKLKKMNHKKYNLAQSRLEQKKQKNFDIHRRAKTNMGVQLKHQKARSPSPDNMNDFDGFFKEQIIHER